MICNECKTKKTSESLTHFKFWQWEMSISSSSGNIIFCLLQHDRVGKPQVQLPLNIALKQMRMEVWWSLGK